MALIAQAVASRALLAIAICCISADAFTQTPGDMQAAAVPGNKHMGCDRLCWQPDMYHPIGSFTCFAKLSTPGAADGYTQAVYSKDIAVGKGMFVSAGPVTSGLACASRSDIPVWGYVKAREVISLTQPPVKVNQVVQISVTGVEYNQKDTFFFPDPNTKDAVNPAADADNK